MQSGRNIFYGVVVLDSFNMGFRDEDNVFEQIFFKVNENFNS